MRLLKLKISLPALDGASLRGKTVLLDPDAADAAVLAQRKDAVAALCVAPADGGGDRFCYKMLISADTHELLLFEKRRYRTPDDARFSEDDSGVSGAAAPWWCGTKDSRTSGRSPR